MSQGFIVFAGFLNKNSEEAEKLKQSSSARLQLLDIDVRSQTKVNGAVEFVKANLPADTPGKYIIIRSLELFLSLTALLRDS